jgi:hypothetical protein
MRGEKRRPTTWPLHAEDHGDDTEEEIMTTSVAEAKTDNGSFAALAGSERTSLLLVATQDAINIQTRVQEDAAINAEAILTQADEALVLG